MNRQPSIPKLQDFETIKFLGRGGFAKVLLVRQRITGRLFALKVLKAKGSSSQAAIEKEVLAEIRSPFIVKLHYTFRNDHKLYMILDFIRGGSLSQLINQKGRLSEDETRCISSEILLALEALHSHGYVCRDLKPENILFDDRGHIRLVDLNLCKKLDTQTFVSFAGTAAYLAPEVIRGEEQSFSVDYWAFGVLLYEMIEGETPFGSANKQDLLTGILQVEPDYSVYFSEEAYDLISKLLVKEPDRRIKSIADMKMHPFWRGVEWERVASKSVTPMTVPHAPNKQAANSTGSSYKTDQYSTFSYNNSISD